MNTLDEMPYTEVIELYYEKHQAIREGNLIKLLSMKNKYPELFDKVKDEQIHNMIEYAKAFQASDRYKELKRMELKEKLFVINNDQSDNHTS